MKNQPANAGDIRDAGSIPGSGISPGGGRGSPLQCSYLENPTDRGAWRAIVHGVAQSGARLKRCSHKPRILAVTTHCGRTVSVAFKSTSLWSFIMGTNTVWNQEASCYGQLGLSPRAHPRSVPAGG